MVMQIDELICRLAELGNEAELVYSAKGDPLIYIRGLNVVPVLWAERLARGELSWDELKQELLAT